MIPPLKEFMDHVNSKGDDITRTELIEAHMKLESKMHVDPNHKNLFSRYKNISVFDKRFKKFHLDVVLPPGYKTSLLFAMLIHSKKVVELDMKLLGACKDTHIATLVVYNYAKLIRKGAKANEARELTKKYFESLVAVDDCQMIRNILEDNPDPHYFLLLEHYPLSLMIIFGLVSNIPCLVCDIAHNTNLLP